jgi:hypothetical protein
MWLLLRDRLKGHELPLAGFPGPQQTQRPAASPAELEHHAEILGARRTRGALAAQRTVPFRGSSEESHFRQQSTTDWARPASLVSLYLLFISFAVCASANTVSSKLTRCLDAISLLAIA